MSYIVIAVIVISVLRTIFSSDPKKKNSNQRARDRAEADSNTGGRPSLDEVTRRKREQLQELARQQRGGRPAAGGNVSAGGDADPGNMTMAERIARARAKQQYEQRAAQAGQGRQAPPAQASPSSRRPVATSGPSGGRAGAGPRQQRAEALRKQLEARKLQQQQAQARRQQQIRQAKAQRSAPPRRGPQSVPPGINTPERDQVHRMVKNVDEKPMEIGSSRRQAETGGAASPSTGRRSTAGINFAKLSKADLRRAFILKEVLDKPAAERDPLADVMGG